MNNLINIVYLYCVANKHYAKQQRNLYGTWDIYIRHGVDQRKEPIGKTKE